MTAYLRLTYDADGKLDGIALHIPDDFAWKGASCAFCGERDRVCTKLGDLRAWAEKHAFHIYEATKNWPIPSPVEIIGQPKKISLEAAVDDVDDF